jgi:site-specific DNA-cytosine methylase
VHRPGLRLQVAPLGVRHEFIAEMRERFTGDCAMDLRFIRRDAEIDDPATLYLTNYEAVREGNVTPARFRAASLDEASVLRSYGSKTYQEFLPAFEPVEFKFVATATPSPNRFKELIHYAAYLGVMDSGQALTRFFQRDSEKAGNLTLYPHKEQEFWLWVASWAVFIQRPSDLGHSDDGYVLPELDVRYHEVPSDYATAGTEKNGQGLLIPDLAMGLSAAATEKRNSLPARVAKVRELVEADPDDHFVIWHDLESERHAIQQAIPEAVSVWGTQDLDEREDRIVAFGDGAHRILSTKPVIAGSGCNFQRHCHREIFAGVGFKFNDFIQAIHRVQRFGQQYRVRIDIVHTEAERDVLRTLQQKWMQHEEMARKMAEVIREYGLNRLAMQDTLARSIGVKRIEVQSELFTVANNDCVEEARVQPDNSVDLIVTSIPFANHYEYSPSYNDFGHTQDNAHFWQQMDYLTPELLRILRPGRIYACHVKDRINFGNVTGAGIPTVSPFHAEALFHGMKHGFDYLGMITIVTDVVRENNQTYRLGYTEMCKDGSKMGVGSPEYVLLFHKPQTDRTKGYADVRIHKEKADYSLARWQVDAHAFWRSSGNRLLSAEEMAGYGPGRLAKVFTGVVGSDLRDPIGTVTAVDHHSLVTANLVHLGHGEQSANGVRRWSHGVRNIADPLNTITASGACAGLVSSTLVKLRGTSTAQGVDEPLHTLSAQGQHFAEVRAFLIKYYGHEKDGVPLTEPMHTIPTHDHFGLVTVHGVNYAIVDIGLRMLTPRELYRAQGFPDSYRIETGSSGEPLTKTAQVRMVGNSVCPPCARAIVAANYRDMSASAERLAA